MKLKILYIPEFIGLFLSLQEIQGNDTTSSTWRKPEEHGGGPPPACVDTIELATIATDTKVCRAALDLSSSLRLPSIQSV
jgi:hypothetical protein